MNLQSKGIISAYQQIGHSRIKCETHGIQPLVKQGFLMNANNAYNFGKYVTLLSVNRDRSVDDLNAEIIEATRAFGNYKINRRDQFVQRVLGVRPINEDRDR